MEADRFIQLVGGLTGTPVKDVTPTDRELLGQLLGDDGRTIGHSQLNELLLLVNKDRMERAFFDYFFGGDSTVGTLGDGVLKFQSLAMLCYGNFIFAYRTLSRVPSVAALEEELGEWARQSEVLAADFAERSPKLVDVELIPREHTSLVGYISAGEVVAEGERCMFLRAAARRGRPAGGDLGGVRTGGSRGGRGGRAPRPAGGHRELREPAPRGHSRPVRRVPRRGRPGSRSERGPARLGSGDGRCGTRMST